MNRSPIDISFIVPVSDRVAFLRDAVSSAISNAGYAAEIIIVDFGPNHQSNEFEEALTAEFPLLRWLRQEHGGAGAARNLGISSARGEFVSFLDSDDLLINSAMEELLRVARAYHSDFVCGLPECFLGDQSWTPQFWRDLSSLRTVNSSCARHPESIRHNAVGGKLYRRDFLQSNHLCFPTNVRRYEDWQFSLTTLKLSEKISFIPRVTYRYRKSATGHKTPANKVDVELLRDLLIVYERLNLIWGAIETPLMRAHRDSHFMGSILHRLKRLLANEANLVKKMSILGEVRPFLRGLSRAARDQLSVRDRVGIELIRVGTLLGGSAFILGDALPHARDLFVLPEVAEDEDTRESLHSFIKTRWWHPRNLLEPLLVIKRRLRPIINYIPRLSPALRVKALVAWILAIGQNTTPKKAWVFGERGGCGGDDSSFFFFRWMRERHPEQDSYFIISRRHLTRIPDELRPWVLRQGSLAHYRLLYRAAVTVFNFSGLDLAEDWRLLGLLRQLPKPHVRVFLNHGVTAIHQVSNHWLFERMSAHFEEHDIFTVSSDLEKRLFVDKMGHRESTLRVTGITRLDGLHEARPTNEPTKQVLYVPTWRPWLRYAHPDTFKHSRFYAEVFQLLHDSRLHAFLEESGSSLTVLAHHVFQPTISQLKSLAPHHVSILDMHSQDVQARLRDAHLLITDYSSISFDFVYMNKPVLYYQFDQSEFFKNRGGFFADPNSELPGITVTTREELFGELRNVISRGWQITPEIERRIANFFQYRDANNCQRVYESIIELLSKRC